MPSLGSRDGRKGLGFGGKMDETEIEEGEAILYSDDDDLTVDPDIALAYLDEKLQNVLGHFQKDFEGGVSAENLGAKFGGYGSFLPTYQRSPVCSHTRTPEVENHALKLPSNFQHEGNFRNITAGASASLPAHCSDISNGRTLPAEEPVTARYPHKLDAGVEHNQPEELTTSVKTSKRFIVPDQKKCRVHIRVGSDNSSIQTKAELYSGLGLLASPSSSFENSSEGEQWSREPHDSPDESPNSIINIMTSFELERGRVLLSPLTKDLAYLTGTKKSLKGRADSTSRSETRKSLNSASGPAARNNRKSLVPGNKKYSTVNAICLSLSNGGTKDVNISKTSEEADDETSPYEMLISKALELPVLSSLDGTDSDMPKSSGKRSELIMGDDKGTISLQLSKAGISDMVVNHNGVDERSTTEVGSVRNMWEDHTETVVGDAEVQSTKSLICMGGKICELNPSETLKTVEQEQNMYMSLKSDMKEGNRESEVFGAETDRSSSKAKSKFKATQGHDIAAESVNRKARDGPSSRSKHEKRKSEVSKHGAENRRLHNGVRNSRYTYKDIFRDLNSECEENGLQSSDYSSGFGPKDSQVNYIGKITLKNRLRVEESCKNTEKTMLSGSQPKTGSHAAPIVTGAVADSLAPAAPVIIKEHWVCCDNCQKWRLLPAGRLPESLPEKWLCSMLDWLPGMNHCEIEEEETTKALVSYQASIPESNKSTIGHIGSSTYGALPSGRTKNLQSAVESRSLNDVYHAPAVSNLDNKHVKKTSYLAVEKKRKMSKDEVKVPEHSSEEVVLPGVMANVTINKKKQPGQYSPRALKKHKIEDPSTEGPLSQTDHQVASTNVDPYARSISQLLGTSRDYIECTEDIPCRNLIGEEIGKSKTFKNSKDQASHSVDGSFVKRKDVTKDSSAKKRKAKGSQAESGHSESLPSVSLKDEEGKCSLKDSSQKFASKEKKARLSSHLPGSISENNSERLNLAVPKDFMHTHDPDRILFKGFKEDMEHSRKYLAPAHPIMEATSSSSKISRSSKSKANLQDTKGSPVESVSSSPLRSRRNARHASNGGRAIDKYCPLSDYGFAVSPKRCSNHDSDGTTGSARHVKMDNSRMGEDFDFPHKGTKSSVGNFEGKSVACDELSNRGTLTKVANTYHKHPREVPVAEARKNSHSLLDVSLTDKKGPSIQSKGRMQKSKFGSGKNNPSNVLNGSRDQIQTHGNKLMGDGLGEHIKPQKLEKEYGVKIPSENGREGSQVKSSADGMQDAKHETIPNLFTSRKIITEDLHGTPNTSSENMILLETIPLPRKSDVRSDYTRYSSHRVNEIENTSVDAYVGYDSLKGVEPVRNENNQKGVEPTVLRHQILTGHSSKGHSSASPARRDASSQSAASAVKEAKSLKHVADRLKSSGSNTESIGLYFQAALKFLLGASLLESSTSETGHRDIVQSTQMYSSTAKLCEFCAREFEKAQDMASAALAYKCTEVAYMRVVFSSHSNANRDRHELQTALQIAPPGESPSSSASDVDNLNNVATGEKFLAKGVCSPQLAGSHVISARSRPIFTRLLNFAQDVSFAMEASRKSRLTLAAADAYLEKVQHDNGINLIRRALDYNFQDVEGLLQLVRLGVEAISR